MTYPKLAECPFCNNAPRHLKAKAGFYTERVICDHCNFYLEATATQTAPERWNACKTPTRSLEESKHLQDLTKALDQCLELRQQLQLAMNYQDADYWIWNPHEDNNLTSMGNRMAVLIYACDLRAALEAASHADEFRVIKECRDRFMVNSASWRLLDDVLQTEPDVKAGPSVVDQPYLWVSPEQAAKITDHPPGEGGRYLPVRKSCDGKFTEPLYRRPPKSQSYLQERSQLDAEWASLRGMQASFNQGTWLPAEEIKALVRQLDVLLNGEAGAAKQATLGDLVSQVRRIVSDKGNSALLNLLP